MNRVAGVRSRFLITKCELQLALEQDEGFFEVVTMGTGTALRWNVHINQTIATCGVGAREEDRVGVAYEADVKRVLVFVRLRKREMAREIIGWNR
jgi:hypothetical protein